MSNTISKKEAEKILDSDFEYIDPNFFRQILTKKYKNNIPEYSSVKLTDTKIRLTKLKDDGTGRSRRRRSKRSRKRISKRSRKSKCKRRSKRNRKIKSKRSSRRSV